jgi:hypothetical protein
MAVQRRRFRQAPSEGIDLPARMDFQIPDCDTVWAESMKAAPSRTRHRVTELDKDRLKPRAAVHFWSEVSEVADCSTSSSLSRCVCTCAGGERG